MVDTLLGLYISCPIAPKEVRTVVILLLAFSTSILDLSEGSIALSVEIFWSLAYNAKAWAFNCMSLLSSCASIALCSSIILDAATSYPLHVVPLLPHALSLFCQRIEKWFQFCGRILHLFLLRASYFDSSVSFWSIFSLTAAFLAFNCCS